MRDIIPMTKRCTKCGVVKDVGEYNKEKKGKYGFASKCRACLKEYWRRNKKLFQDYRKDYYKKNKERIAIKSKKYYENNKEQVKRGIKEWCKKNKARVQNYRKRYRKKNREENNLKRKERYKKNPEKELLKAKEYRQRPENKEQRKKYFQEYSRKPYVIEMHKLYSKKYQKKNPDNIKTSRFRFYRKHQDSILKKEKKERDNLVLSYIKTRIVSDFKYHSIPVFVNDVTPEMIEAKRDSIKAKRLLRRFYERFGKEQSRSV